MSDAPIQERLRTADPQGTAWSTVPGDLIAEAAATIDRLTARIAELEKALKPLAQVPDKGAYPDSMRLQHPYSPIRYGDVRFARATLEASERGG